MLEHLDYWITRVDWDPSIVKIEVCIFCHVMEQIGLEECSHENVTYYFRGEECPRCLWNRVVRAGQEVDVIWVNEEEEG